MRCALSLHMKCAMGHQVCVRNFSIIYRMSQKVRIKTQLTLARSSGGENIHVYDEFGFMLRRAGLVLFFAKLVTEI